ncbi:MAG: dihydrolipoamide acetyltransferase family protein [Deltaproteobacteria bacterium]
MRFEFKLPDIGEGVIEGEVVRWLVQDGDSVQVDQPLVEVMTDKATVVIPSPKAGKVVERRGTEGGMAKVHETLVVIEVGEAAAGAATTAAPVKGATKEPAIAAPAPQKPAVTAPAPVQLQAAAATGERVRATPVTRKLAAEHGVDLGHVAGSGPGGRVLKNDVLALVSNGGAAPGSSPVPARRPAGEGPLEERIPIRGLRKRIAEKMQRSKRTAAHFTFVEEVDCSRLVELRQRLNDAQAKAEGGVKLSYLPFIVKAVIEGLRRYPTLNASVDDEKNELVVKHSYNLGIAAATPDGLIVPVIHGADRLSLRGIAQEIERLAGDARVGKSRLDDLQGGTFTITSLGQTGGLFATPVINHPEVAILGVHRMRPRPVVRDGQIVVRDMMYLSCSFDHRVIDGSVGAQFTYEIIKYLENPELLLLELA